MTVEPRYDGAIVTCGVCDGAVMHAEVGCLLEEPGTWLWYRCVWNPKHVTRALPLPESLSVS